MQLCLLLACIVLGVQATDRPIVGILTTGPTSVECSTITEYRQAHKLPVDEDGGCFSAFYVKWLEQAGMRAVPIPFSASEERIRQLHASVNGVLFTGGGLSLLPNTTYYQTAKLLLDLSIEANSNGDYFPVWGTCMGFQLLSILVAEDNSVLSDHAYDSEDLSLPLDFTAAAPASKMFGHAPQDIYETFAYENVTSNLHHDGVAPELFQTNQKLKGFFNLVSTSRDRQGKEFSSTIEGKHFPVYGTQWHPERQQYEWKLDMGFNHSEGSLKAMFYASTFLASEARKSEHAFASVDEEERALIYNYQPHYLGDSYQVYYITNEAT